MNREIPLRSWSDPEARITLVHLDPLRYNALERQYIAARVTRTFDHPDKILNDFALQNPVESYNAHQRQQRLDQAMKTWLKERIVDDYHYSVTEFAGQEYALWISGCSLGTIRDLDRHRLHSYEEYTTRALGKSLKQHIPALEEVVAAYTDYRWRNTGDGIVPLALLTQETGRPTPASVFTYDQRQFLLDLFYVHPLAWQEQGEARVDLRLGRAAEALLDFIYETQDSSKRFAADINRDMLTLGLRTPFLMAGNQRAWAEVMTKRTCYQVGHHEYVTISRGATALLSQVAHFLPQMSSAWCPKGRTGAQCCRTKFMAEVTAAVPDYSSLQGLHVLSALNGGGSAEPAG